MGHPSLRKDNIDDTKLSNGDLQLGPVFGRGLIAPGRHWIHGDVRVSAFGFVTPPMSLHVFLQTQDCRHLPSGRARQLL
jgi:hypothetical protein